jgi:hypothetical protein
VIAPTNARASSSVSSTATRADGPRSGAKKSMFTVWPNGAWTGWST